MAILGKIIKGAIHLTSSLSSDSKSAKEMQLNVLEDILSTAKHTAFGRHYNFEKILESNDLREAFASTIPLHDYKAIYDGWWHRLLESEPDVCWPGTIEYFALSSGTSGSPSKHIPVSDEMIKAIRQTGIQQVVSLANFNLPSDFFAKEILMLGSSTDLADKGEYYEGEISGISASKIPFWFDKYYKPGRDIAQIDDWEERINQIALKAKDWDIGALSGIPAWIQLMLERVIEHHNLTNIHEIWPNLQVYATGGVAFEPYRKSFEKLFAKPLIYVDTYLASEGFMAFQARPETQAMALALENGIYFEFIPFNGEYFNSEGEVKPGIRPLGIADVKTDQEYALVISTCSGAWRYMLGDTIRFTDLERHEILITGRTKHFMNVAGSQMTIEHMNNAIGMLEESLNVTIQEFTMTAIPHEGHFAHKWYLGTDDALDPEVARQQMDEYLQEINKNYKRARTKALKDIFVEVVTPDCFYNWLERTKKKGGQIKMPRVLKDEQWTEWEDHARQSQHPTVQDRQPLKNSSAARNKKKANT
jgi:hypothetical protein